jgi:hypothetical protein
MINLKLAEYDLNTGKFQEFLELYNLCKFSKEIAFLLGQDSIRIIEHEICGDYWDYEKDKKDPLNRFNGLFDGRTFERGKFVLIRDNEDDYENIFEYSMTKKEDGEWQPSGNLHENPELYEKIKNI